MEPIALIAIDLPDTATPAGNNRWLSFAASLAGISGIDEPSSKLSENLWLFDLRNGVSTFAGLVAAADKAQLPYTVRFFSSPPILVRST